MRKLIEGVISVFIFCLRIYFISKVIIGLYLNHSNPDGYPLDGISWYIYALILDLYIVKIYDNSVPDDIYSKNEDE